MRLFLYLLLTMFSAQAAASYCYQLTRGDALIYQGSTPPFDVSYDLDNGMSEDIRRSQASGEQLVFFSGSCARGGSRIDSEGRYRSSEDGRTPVSTSSRTGTLQLDRIRR